MKLKSTVPGIVAGLYLLTAWQVRPAAASIEDCLAATCRISSNGSVGTGCAFEVRDGEIRILTNYHVAEGRPVNVQFYDRGHESAKLYAASRWFSFHDAAQRDMNIVAVPLQAFAPGEPLPKLIPLGKPNEQLPPGRPICSAGCEEGRWPSAWIGHIVQNEGRIIKFVPKAIPGRSGSALFDERGKRIIGLIAWHDGTYGVAMTIGDIWAAFNGQMPVEHRAPILRRPRPLDADELEAGVPLVKVELPLSQRKCIHGVALSQPCQFCGPGGCQPFQGQRPRFTQPYGQQPQQPGNGGAYPTRPPDEQGPAAGGTMPDLSNYATKDDLSALETKLIGQAKDLLGSVPNLSAIEQRVSDLESSQGSSVSHGFLSTAIENAEKRIAEKLNGNLSQAKEDLLGAADKKLGDGFTQINRAVESKIEAQVGGAVAGKVNELVLPKLAPLATIAAGTGAAGIAGVLPSALAGGIPGLAIALVGWLISRKIGGSGGAAAGRPFPGNQNTSGY